MTKAEMLRQIMDAERSALIPRGSTRAFITQRDIADLTGPTEAEEEVQTCRDHFREAGRILADVITLLRDGEQPPSRRIETAEKEINRALWVLEEGE